MKNEDILAMAAEALSTQVQHVPSTIKRMQKEIRELDAKMASLKK